MSLAVAYSRAQHGIDAPLVRVETHLSNGLPGLCIVGLPEATVRESKDRVRSAIINSNYDFPHRRITINLAPADLPKQGSRFDLAIALAILGASGQIPLEALEDKEFVAELALGGQLRPVSGTLSAAIAGAKAQHMTIVSPINAGEAAYSDNQVGSSPNLAELCRWLQGEGNIDFAIPSEKPVARRQNPFSDILGHDSAKRAIQIAAAGGHHLLMCGPPGTGKTLLASRLPLVLPPLAHEEAIELAAIRSLCDYNNSLSQWFNRPFRSPHHTASAAALVGGGNPPSPGEISLAHHGVLFLDELPEFQRHVLEVLREPMESGEITIARARHQLRFPCRFQLVAAMNPCPCGYFGDSEHHCSCTPDQVRRYLSKISGPLLDRFDMHLRVDRIPTAALTQRQAAHPADELNNTIQADIDAARNTQIQRQGRSNQALDPKAIRQYCDLDADCEHTMQLAIKQLKLSTRGFYRIIKVARSIADLDNSSNISATHIKEALSYRTFPQLTA